MPHSVDVQEDTVEVPIRAEGLVSLATAIRQTDPRKAA